MPKDKTSIKGFALTAKEAENQIEKLRTAADYSNKEVAEEKAEPQDPAVRNCYYFASDPKCPGPMGDECSYVIKNGTMVMAHRSCQKRSQNAEKKTPNVMIR